jgi:zinc transport system substrate-binding protein
VERLAKAEGRRQMATISGGIPTRKPTPLALEEFGKAAEPSGKHEHDHDDDDDHPTDVDPHLWMDPLLAEQLVKRIAGELVKLAPQHKAAVEERQAGLVSEIQKLHEDFDSVSKKFQKREVVTFHGAFSYLLARYDVKEAAIIQMFPGDEPSAAYLRKLVDLVRGKGITVVFAETGVPDRAARVISKEIGGSVETLDPMERQLVDAPERGYVERQRANLEILKRVLGQKSP